jgi:hypothetical protein
MICDLLAVRLGKLFNLPGITQELDKSGNEMRKPGDPGYELWVERGLVVIRIIFMKDTY